jgi:hypothetical protein
MTARSVLTWRCPRYTRHPVVEFGSWAGQRQTALFNVNANRLRRLLGWYRLRNVRHRVALAMRALKGGERLGGGATVTSRSAELARAVGKPIRPAALFADRRQSHRAALLAAKSRAGNLTVAEPGRRRVDGSAMPALGAGHLDFQVITRQIAERGAGGRQRHAPRYGGAMAGRNPHATFGRTGEVFAGARRGLLDPSSPSR